ncbi:hypothetical protein [Pseudomarimonas arenosa]|uniref:Uncharacterized protein n=1 Tax=Pseudomarimonas arenosa TaxID=2774145 RepID=A0AAW3ZPD4_9GAMM|nr:hypothetical protein [Pseudomarimonas arenosa]MBD8526146.1 hypothetical protein [Pseudomarimonas arenosa]
MLLSYHSTTFIESKHKKVSWDIRVFGEGDTPSLFKPGCIDMQFAIPSGVPDMLQGCSNHHGFIGLMTRTGNWRFLRPNKLLHCACGQEQHNVWEKPPHLDLNLG